MAANITNIYVFDAISYEKDTNDEIQDAAGSNDIFPYITKTVRHERLGEPIRYDFTLAAGSEWNTDFLIKSRHRLYVTYSDASVIPLRVTSVKFNAASSDVRVQAEHLWGDLGERHLIYVREPDAEATPQFPLARLTFDAALDIIFDSDHNCPSIFVKGTVDASVSSKIVILSSAGATFAELLKEACKQAGAEFTVEYNTGNPGTIDFDFDDTIGTQTTPSDRAIQNNRFKNVVDDAQDGYISRIIPFASGDGENISISDGWLYVDSGTEVGPGSYYSWVFKGSPFAIDDMYVGTDHYLELYTSADPDEIRTDLTINNVVASTSTLETANTGLGGVSPNDVIKIRIHSTVGQSKTSTGTPVNFIANDTAEASKGVSEDVRFYDDVSGYDNLFEVIADGSGDMSTGSTDGNGNYVPDGMNLFSGTTNAVVTDIDTGTDTLTVSGDHTNGLYQFDTITLTGSTDNDGSYDLLVNPVYSSGPDTTAMTLDAALPGTDTDDGYVSYSAEATTSTVSSAQFINAGTASMKVEANSGGGVKTDTISITATQKAPYISVWANVSVESGRVAMRVYRDSDGYTDIEDAIYEGIEIRGMALSNVAPIAIGSTGNIRVEFEALEDTTVFHVDALAVTQHKGVGEVPYRQYMGTAGLMERAGIDILAEGGELLPQYVVDVYDDQANEIHLGCSVELKDLPITGGHAIDETPRVIEIRCEESINGRPRKEIKIARETKRADTRFSFIGAGGVGASKVNKAATMPPMVPLSTASLMANSRPGIQTVIVTEDGKGRILRRDSTGYSGAADGGINVGSLDGRTFKTASPGPYDMMFWNPTADGSTDDKTEVYKALRSGGKALSVNKPPNADSLLISDSSGAGDIITGINDVQVIGYGGKLEGKADTSSDQMFRIESSSRMKFLNNYFDGGFTSYDASGTSGRFLQLTHDTDKFLIGGNYFYGLKGTGVHNTSSADNLGDTEASTIKEEYSIITGNWFDTIHTAQNTRGGSRYGIIVNNHVLDCGAGFKVDGETLTTLVDFLDPSGSYVISNNVLANITRSSDASGNGALQVEENATDVVLTSNVIDGVTRLNGFIIQLGQSTVDVRRVTFSNNIVRDVDGGYGFKISSFQQTALALDTAITLSSSVTSIDLTTGIDRALAIGDKVMIQNGSGEYQIFVLDTAAAKDDTTLSVTSKTADFAFAVNDDVEVYNETAEAVLVQGNQFVDAGRGHVYIDVNSPCKIETVMFKDNLFQDWALDSYAVKGGEPEGVQIDLDGDYKRIEFDGNTFVKTHASASDYRSNSFFVRIAKGNSTTGIDADIDGDEIVFRGNRYYNHTDSSTERLTMLEAVDSYHLSEYYLNGRVHLNGGRHVFKDCKFENLSFYIYDDFDTTAAEVILIDCEFVKGADYTQIANVNDASVLKLYNVRLTGAYTDETPWTLNGGSTAEVANVFDENDDVHRYKLPLLVYTDADTPTTPPLQIVPNSNDDDRFGIAAKSNGANDIDLIIGRLYSTHSGTVQSDFVIDKDGDVTLVRDLAVGRNLDVTGTLDVDGATTKVDEVIHIRKTSSGSGTYAGQLIFDKANGSWSGAPHISLEQQTADADQLGYDIFVHESATFGDAAVRALRIRYDRALDLYADTQTTVGSAGAGDALPANPEGYVEVYIGGTLQVIPYYEP